MMSGAVSAGWLSDPSGQHQHRYWDGAQWTDQVADNGVQATDAGAADWAPPSAEGAAAAVAAGPVAVAVQAPTKVCRSCGAQTQTAAAKCPNCGKAYKKRKVWPWVLLSVFLVFGGCTALVVAGVNGAVNELNKEQKSHAITQAQFDSVPLGSSRDQVIATLGKQPENVQEFKSKGVVSEADLNLSCIYYNKVGGKFGDRYQLCFDNDALNSKNYYG